MIIDQKLIEYVKKEILRGASSAETRKRLIRAGWREKEVAEAFEFAKKQTHSLNISISNLGGHKIIEENAEGKPKIIIALIISIFLVIVCIVGVTTYFVFGEKKSGTGISLSSTESAAGLDIKDCTNDFECFIESSKNCGPAKVIYTYTIDISGIKKTTTMEYELKGLEADKCIFYMKTKNLDMKYSEELIQQMKNSGISQESIIKKEQVENIKSDSLEGKEATCKIMPNDLIEMLNIWKSDSSQAGVFSKKCQDIKS